MTFSLFKVFGGEASWGRSNDICCLPADRVLDLATPATNESSGDSLFEVLERITKFWLISAGRDPQLEKRDFDPLSSDALADGLVL
ncbi:MAG: hypothetical protein AMJ41_01685 [candidate division Zixibacteria bacterium DG_27]|nr:MAG: hypothetical protein AMJ41_01685 [candidate division Zixibacteria bacterium DG_27]